MSFVYEIPVAGSTPPTEPVASKLNLVAGVYTGVSLTTSFTITHNLAVSAADLTDGLPEVEFEPLTANFYSEHPAVTSKTGSTVVISVVGTATDEFMRVRVIRPSTITR